MSKRARSTVHGVRLKETSSTPPACKTKYACVVILNIIYVPRKEDIIAIINKHC